MQQCHGMSVAATATLLLTTVVLAGLLVPAHAAPPPPQKESNYHTTGYQSAGLGNPTWDYVDFRAWPETCRSGMRQSPISFVNVDPSEVVNDPKLRRLKFSPECIFKPEQTKMEIVNDGNIISVMFETDGTVPGDMSPCTVEDPLEKGVAYHLLGLHFHAKSEHKFRNIMPDVEMHLVFGTESQDESKQRILQVAIMLMASSSVNTTSVRALRHILVEGSLPLPHTKTTCFLSEELPLLSFLPGRENYLAYDGSNTFPPCQENVRWVVMTSPILISRLALGKLRNAMDETMPNDFHRFGNARPPQALNGRRIYRFTDLTGTKVNEGKVKDIWKKNDAAPQGVDAEGQTVTAVGSRARKPAALTSFVTTEEVPRESQRPLAANDTADSQADNGGRNHSGSSVNHGGHERSAPEDASNSAHATGGSKSGSIDGDRAHATESSTTAVPAEDSASTASSDVVNGGGITTTTASSSETATATARVASEHESSTTTTTTEEPTTTTSTTTTTTAAPSTTTTTTTTTTTKAPSPKKGKGKKSTTDTLIEKGKAVKDSVSETVTSSGIFAKGRSAVSKSVDYVKTNPTTVAVIAMLVGLTLFTIIASIRAWRRPAYVAGVSPEELQLLSGTNRRAYGTSSPVEPPMP